MTSPDTLVASVYFSLNRDECEIIEAAAAERGIKPSQWIKSVALELARTVAENRAAKSERRDHHQKN